MISTFRERYALLAVFDLAMAHKEGTAFIQLEEIAKRYEIPKSYLLQIMRQLGVAGILRSARGPNGGYKLARRPAEISFGDIVRALNGQRMVIDAPGMPPQLDSAWTGIMQEMMSVLDTKTIADIIE